MNVLLILSALKKGWSYTKGFLALALKYWYIVIIALLLAIATSLRNDVNNRAINYLMACSFIDGTGILIFAKMLSFKLMRVDSTAIRAIC